MVEFKYKTFKNRNKTQTSHIIILIYCTFKKISYIWNLIDFKIRKYGSEFF